MLAVQDGLRQLARPWNRRYALRVFRDETGLSVSPALWPSIQAALDEAEYFVFLASPEAARSEWVNKELAYWLANKPVERLLPVVTKGRWHWDPVRGDFDPVLTDAAPPALLGAFQQEPRYLDLTWARDETELHLRNSRFRAAIADLAAPIHGLPKDELEGEDIRQHRRTMRLRNAAVTGLAVLAIVATIGGFVALAARNEAERQAGIAAEQARVATSRALAASALTLVDTRHDRALLLAAEAMAIDPGAESRSALLTAVGARPRLIGYRHGPARAVRQLVMSADGSMLLALFNGGLVLRWRGDTLHADTLQSAGRSDALALDEAGKAVITLGTDGTFHRHDLLSGRDSTWSVRAAPTVLLTPDGRRYARLDGNGVWFGARGRATEIRRALSCDLTEEALAIVPDGSGVICGSRRVDRDGTESLTGLEMSFGSSAILPGADGELAAAGWNGSLLRTPAGAAFVDSLAIGFVDDRAMGAVSLPVTLALARLGVQLVSSDDRGRVTFWEIGGEVDALNVGSVNVTAMATSTRARRLATGLADGRIALWDVSHLGDYGTAFERRPRLIVSFSRDGRLMIGGAGDVFAAAWRVREGTLVRALSRCRYSEVSPMPLQDAWLSPDGTRVACVERGGSGDGDPAMVILSLDSGRRSTIPAKSGVMIGWVTDSVVVTIREERAGGMLQWWSLADGAFVAHRGWERTRLPLHCGRVALDTMGSRLAVVTPRGLLLGRDGTLDSLPIPLRAGCRGPVVVSPDGRLVAALHEDGGVALWDAETRSLRAHLRGHAAEVTTLAFSVDGRYLASGYETGVVRLWDVATGQPVGGELRLHGNGVTALTFADSGRTLVSSDSEGVVRFAISDSALAARACATAGRVLGAEERRVHLESVERPFVACGRGGRD